MFSAELVHILRCPVCRSRLAQAGERLECTSCKASFPISDGVPILLGGDEKGTQLDKIDYDAVHRITDANIEQIGTQWAAVIGGLDVRRPDVLEIGSGTGALTLGLLKKGVPASIIATDISAKFMSALLQRGAAYGATLRAVVCDANTMSFADEAFDLVLGRSILHHLIDYPLVLRRALSLLKPGGFAIFFEPVLQGKSIIALFVALMLRADAARATPALSPEEKQKLTGLLRHQTKHRWYPQTREALSKLEDKFIFDLEELKELCASIGYRRVTFESHAKVDDTYWPFVKNTLLITGISQQTLEGFRWIADAFADSAFVASWHAPTPMGYFVMQK